MREAHVAAVLEETVARQEITHAIARLQRGIDRVEGDLLSSAFHDDAELDYGFFVGGAAEFCDIMTGPSGRARHEVTMHRPTNAWIRVEGARAVAEIYVIALDTRTGDDGDVDTLSGGRYLDRFEEIDGAPGGFPVHFPGATRPGMSLIRSTRTVGEGSRTPPGVAPTKSVRSPAA